MAIPLRQQGHFIHLGYYCWFCAPGALVPIVSGRRHYLICASGIFFFIIPKVTEIDWKVPLRENKEAFTGPFFIRQNRNKDNVLQTASYRSADLRSGLWVREMQFDCSAQIFLVVPFHPHGKCTLLNSSSRSSHRNKRSCEWT